MIAGIIDVQWIKWNERTMDLRGTSYYYSSLVTVAVAYAHVAAASLEEGRLLRIDAGGRSFEMRFQDADNARDTMAELARRMAAEGAATPTQAPSLALR